MGYRIKTVSELTGIPKNTLVSWERRYRVLDPQRRLNRYRTYSDGDIAILRRLKGYLDEGLRISEAVERLRSAPAAAAPAAASLASATESDAAIRDQLQEALLRFDRGEADRVVLRLLAVPYLHLLHNIYFPILRQVGEGWAAGRVSVAQEHFASTFLRDQLVAMLLRAGSGPEVGAHVVCATFPGDKHEIALLGLAVHLSMSGYRVTYLGTDLPLRELRQFTEQHRPACVFVSVINAATRAQLVDYAEELRAGVPAETRIIIGGRGLPERTPTIEGVSLQRDWQGLALA